MLVLSTGVPSEFLGPHLFAAPATRSLSSEMITPFSDLLRDQESTSFTAIPGSSSGILPAQYAPQPARQRSLPLMCSIDGQPGPVIRPEPATDLNAASVATASEPAIDWSLASAQPPVQLPSSGSKPTNTAPKTLVSQSAAEKFRNNAKQSLARPETSMVLALVSQIEVRLGLPGILLAPPSWRILPTADAANSQFPPALTGGPKYESKQADSMAPQPHDVQTGIIDTVLAIPLASIQPPEKPSLLALLPEMKPLVESPAAVTDSVGRRDSPNRSSVGTPKSTLSLLTERLAPAVSRMDAVSGPKPVISARDSLAFKLTLTPLETALTPPISTHLTHFAAGTAAEDQSRRSIEELQVKLGDPARRDDPLKPAVVAPTGEADFMEKRHSDSPPDQPEAKNSVVKDETLAQSSEQLSVVASVTTPRGDTTQSKDQPIQGSLPNEKSASKSEINPASQPPPVREISVKVSQAEMPNVDVRLSDRGGKVLVSVRSESPELAQALRSELGDLVGRLERRGYQSETTIGPQGSAVHLQATNQPRDFCGSGTAGQQSSQHNQQDSRRRPPRHVDAPLFSMDEVSTHEHELNQ